MLASDSITSETDRVLSSLATATMAMIV